ncbi:MAG TPA: polysaccharide deacetylase family protein [Usitatibacter sp.]|nr:polysaccharide deacetylase family protein [Usitatibacter sp.]
MSTTLEARDRPRPWRPTPAIAASIGLHGVAAASLLATPAAWPWALGALAANQLVLGACGLLPRTHWIGRNMTRLPQSARERREIAITVDDGPDPEVTPRLLDLLDERSCSATFFCIGERVLAHPDLCREIARRGHAVENHSMTHTPTFALQTLEGYRREVRDAQAAIARATGSEPRFFRAPMGFRNPLLDPVLHEAGLALAAWTRRSYDTKQRDARVVAARLTRGFAAGDILLLHDGHAARTGRGVPVLLEALPRILDDAERLALRPVTLRRAVQS